MAGRLAGQVTSDRARGGRTKVRESVRSVVALAALSMAAFCYVTVELLPVGLLPVIAADVDVSLSAVGLLVTGYAVTVAVASLPLTHVVRRILRRYLLTALLAVFVVATSVSVLGGYRLLLGGRIATALSQAVFWAVVAPAAAALFSAQYRGRVTAAVFSGGSLATVVGVPGGTWLGQQTSWRVAFLTVAGLGLLAMIAVAVLLPSTSPAHGQAASGSAPHTRRYWLTIAATAVAITGGFAGFTYITPFLTDVSGFAPGAVTWILLVYGVAGLVGVVVGGAMARSHRHSRAMCSASRLAARTSPLPSSRRRSTSESPVVRSSVVRCWRKQARVAPSWPAAC